jgi:formylglycine-generating enzyme required for sulfatase activity
VKEARTPAYGPDGRVDFQADGYRLPTEAEWEYAATVAGSGPGQERIYPFGMDFDSQALVYQTREPGRVGSCRSGDTPLGVCDMAGNVREWCSDNYFSYVSAQESYRFVDDAPDTLFVTRGGGFLLESRPFELRAAYRDRYWPAEVQFRDIGFRLVRSTE